MGESEIAVRTKEVSEAAILYMNGFPIISYSSKHWHFGGDAENARKLKLDLVNKKLKVEPLEYLDAVRRVKAFSNESNG